MNKITQKLAHGAIALALLGNYSAFTSPLLTKVAAIEAIEATLEATSLAAKSPLDEGVKRMTVRITAYSSTPDQTDDTPFITAAGTHVRDGIVAANFVPLYTRIKIPELFGERVFIVEDRMNRRYRDRVDIWFADRESARKFGIKDAEIVVL